MVWVLHGLKHVKYLEQGLEYRVYSEVSVIIHFA